MEQKSIIHFLYVPFTGLGLYDGYRGDRWLKNRIQIFKQFVLPSILKHWKQNMILWVSWRNEERTNPLVLDFELYLRLTVLRRTVIGDAVFTYNGVCFWDDKYSDEEASMRLKHSLNLTLPVLSPFCRNAEKVWMTIQPSDDIYLRIPRGNEGWLRGYIMNYLTGEIAEYDPTTSPPFYTIEFPVSKFLSPTAHYQYIGPYKSHEYVKDFLPIEYINERQFVVGTHGENISTGFDIPFRGDMITPDSAAAILERAGLTGIKPLRIRRGWIRTLFFKLPHPLRRKLRYWLGERFYAKIHKYVTNH